MLERLELHALFTVSIALLDDTPVEDVPEFLEVVSTAVLVVEVVGMLPDVDSDERNAASCDGRAGILITLDEEVPFRIG